MTYSFPFRWNLAKQEQLGKLIDSPLSRPNLHEEFIPSCAKIIAYGGDSDFVFIGRSPENFFDYLSGALSQTSWQDRLTLLHFSMRFQEESLIREKFPEAISAYRTYLASLNLHPHGIATRAHPVALVDLVVTGDTFSRLIYLLYNWCQEIGYDWLAVKRRLKIVGMTSRTHNSPNTERWHQKIDWAQLIEQSAIKNISLEWQFWRELGDLQQKVTQSYHPAHWGKDKLSRPEHGDNRINALQHAYALFEIGKQWHSRQILIRCLGGQPAIKEGWFRQLIQELRF